MMKLDALLSPWVSETLPSVSIESIENDSRNVSEGSLFVAYPGGVVDGRDFIQHAISAGAVAIAYESSDGFSAALSEDIALIPVQNLAEKLRPIAELFYPVNKTELSVTGVTGTNGKTTIAYLLAQAYEILNGKAAYVGTLGEGCINTLNKLANTTPDALVLQKLFYRYQQEGISQITMEVSSHALAQHRVDGIEFNQAIYTNLSQDHLDYHKTMDEYAAAKAKHFAWPTLKYAIMNYDDPMSSFMTASVIDDCKVYTYGLHPKADIRALDMHTHQQGMTFNITSPWGDFCLQTSLIGQFNLYNILAIFTNLVCAGLSPTEVVEAIRHLHTSPGRMEVVAQNPQVIVDFAHSPDALENVLKTIQQLTQGRIIVVFGCGGERDQIKRPLMGQVASQFSDHVIITNDNPRGEKPESIAHAIQSGVSPNQSFEIILDRKTAIETALRNAGVNDTILIAGKGHEDYQIIGDQIIPFSDQKTVNSLLMSLRKLE